MSEWQIRVKEAEDNLLWLEREMTIAMINLYFVGYDIKRLI